MPTVTGAVHCWMRTEWPFLCGNKSGTAEFTLRLLILIKGRSFFCPCTPRKTRK